MAWPFSPLTTYVPGSTPAIAASDLNNIQSAINDGFIVSSFVPPMAGTDTPQVLYRDAAGNNRSLVDKNGFPLGALSYFHEEWMIPIATGSGTGPIVSPNPFWFMETTANAQLTSGTFLLTFPANSIELIPGSASTNRALLYCQGLVGPGNATSIAFEFDFKFNYIPHSNNITWTIGLNNNLSSSPSTASGDAFGFYTDTSSTTWFALNSNHTGPSLQVTNTGVTVDTNWHQFKCEYHGVNTPIGVAACYSLGANTAKTLFYIDGALVVSFNNSTFLPTAAMNPLIEGYCVGATSTSNTAQIGPLSIVWNRWASIAAV